jgi:hypothetical protein
MNKNLGEKNMKRKINGYLFTNFFVLFLVIVAFLSQKSVTGTWKFKTFNVAYPPQMPPADRAAAEPGRANAPATG